MELNQHLTPHLKHLRLSGILETLEARHRQAVEGKWSYIEFLQQLLQDEVERRGQKQLNLPNQLKKWQTYSAFTAIR